MALREAPDDEQPEAHASRAGGPVTSLVPIEDDRGSPEEAARLTAEGIPDELARRHAFQDELVHGPDIISVSRATGRAVLEVARGFFLDGRYPHATAVLAESAVPATPRTQWAIDSWPTANAEPPVIQRLDRWLAHRPGDPLPSG